MGLIIDFYDERKVDQPFVAIFGLMVGLFIAELGLRLAGISYSKFYHADNLTGHSLIPGAEGWYRDEGEAYIRINSAGFRDQDRKNEKPTNTLRIAVLGDSFSEARQVPLENTFWAVAENNLEGCSQLGRQRLEVLNFGVSSYGTAQELLTLRDRVWDYSPDIVMLAFTTANDISDNLRELKKLEQSAQSKVIPYFIYRGNKLVLDNSFLESDAYVARMSQSHWNAFITYSRLLQFLRHTKKLSKTNWRVKQSKWLTENQGRFLEPSLLDDVYTKPISPEWRDAWRLTEDLLILMQDEVIENDSAFIVVTLSNGIQVHPDSAVRERFKKSLGITNLFYPDMRIKALGNRMGFPVINLAPLMLAYAKEYKKYLHGFENTKLGIGHWNETGHHLAGQIIANEICSRHLLIGNAKPSHHK